MFNISVNFKETKKGDHILKSSLDFQSFFDALDMKNSIKPKNVMQQLWTTFFEFAKNLIIQKKIILKTYPPQK